jgi:hypothetical protein
LISANSAEAILYHTAPFGWLGSVDGRSNELDGRLGEVDEPSGELVGRREEIVGRSVEVVGRSDEVFGKLREVFEQSDDLVARREGPAGKVGLQLERLVTFERWAPRQILVGRRELVREALELVEPIFASPLGTALSQGTDILDRGRDSRL